MIGRRAVKMGNPHHQVPLKTDDTNDTNDTNDTYYLLPSTYLPST